VDSELVQPYKSVKEQVSSDMEKLPKVKMPRLIGRMSKIQTEQDTAHLSQASGSRARRSNTNKSRVSLADINGSFRKEETSL